MLLGVFGAFSMFSYGPGGWLADRFSSRKLITLAMVFTGGTGFLLTPVFPTTTWRWPCTCFGGSLISPAFLERHGTRQPEPGVQRSAGACVWVSEGRARPVRDHRIYHPVGRASPGSAAPARPLQLLLPAASAIITLCGVAAWFVLEDDGPGSKTDPETGETKSRLARVKLALKMPAVWLIAIVIAAATVKLLGHPSVHPVRFASLPVKRGHGWGVGLP